MVGVFEEDRPDRGECCVNPRRFRSGCGLDGICELVEVFQEMLESWIGFVRVLWVLPLLLLEGLEYGSGFFEVLDCGLLPLRCLGEEFVRLGELLLGQFELCLC